MFSDRTSWNLAPNAFTVALEAHRRAGRKVLDLTASNPTEVGLQYDPAILAALANGAALHYHPEPKGLLAAREAVAEYYASLANAPITRSSRQPISAGQIILTVSTSEAYSFVFRLLCNAGDQVLVPTPSYPLFEFLAVLQDVRLVPYALFYDHGWHVDFHSLESALTPRSRAVVLVHPNNPTGSYVKVHEIAQLNAICAARDLALVVDEVFLDYHIRPAPSESRPAPAVDGPAFRSFAFNHSALTFTLSGISKISALPQMKLAWIVTSGPQPLREQALARLEVIADTYLSMNTPVQLAAPALLRQRHSIREQLVRRVEANLAELDRQLDAQTLCARLQVEGGWYATLRVPVTRTDEQFVIELLQKTDVLVQPGYFYDFHSDGYLVLSLITPEETFAEGLARLLAFLM